MTFMLSDQQQDIVDYVLDNSKGALEVIARAGCGKSTTIVQCVTSLYHRTSYEIFIGAYNKPIAEEMKKKVIDAGIDDWRRVQVGTLHAAGNAAWRKLHKDVKIDTKGEKVPGIIDAIRAQCIQSAMTASTEAKRDLLHRKAEVATVMRDFAVKAVGFAKQRAFGFLCSIEDRKAWFDLVDHFGLDEEVEDIENDDERTFLIDEGISLAIAAYKKSISMDKEIIDFNDMILAPLIHNVRMYGKDFVFVDEAQDTNPARRALALKMLKPRTGRLVFVGDDRQGIYGFTGADADAMPQLKAATNATTLYLTETRRCPQAVVQFANQWVPDLRAHASNGEGAIRAVKYATLMAKDRVSNDNLWYGDITPDDVILCRNNAPLVQIAFDLLSRGIACKVEGKDIIGGIVKLARRWKSVKTLRALDTKLDDYLTREIQKTQAKGNETQAAAIEDKVNILKVMISKLVIDGKNTVDDLVEFITTLFGDTTDATQQKKVVTLCSGHKSKGREWKKVFWLDRAGTMPSKWAKKEWSKVQEENLAYVMATRAMDELIEIEVEKAFYDKMKKAA